MRPRLAYESAFQFLWKLKQKVTLHTCHESSDPRCSRIEKGRRIVHIKGPISSSTAKAGIPLFTVPLFSLVFVLSPHPLQRHLSQAEWLFQTHFTATSLTNIPLPCVPPPLLSMWQVHDLSLSKFASMWVWVHKYVLWFSVLGWLKAPLVYIL